MNEQEEPSYELVIPFVSLASKGGPHEDQAYVAGYEMGRLDAVLEHQRPPVLDMTIRLDNRHQADLIAMHRGYAMRIVHDWGTDGWLSATFTHGIPPANT